MFAQFFDKGLTVSWVKLKKNYTLLLSKIKLKRVIQVKGSAYQDRGKEEKQKSLKL